MKTITLKFTGIRPLLMNSPRGLDSRDELQKEIQKINDKRGKKTDEDMEKRDYLQYQVALYFDSKIGPYIPATVLEAVLRDGAKTSKLGKKMQAGAFVAQDPSISLSDGNYGVPLSYDGPREIQELYKIHDHVFRTRVVQSGKAIMKVRPRFMNWSVEFTVEYDDSVIGKRDIESAAANAGALIGLLDYRPKFGRFNVETL